MVCCFHPRNIDCSLKFSRNEFFSSGKRTRILVIELISAEFLNKYKKSRDIYANLWIDEDLKLQSKMVRCAKATPSPMWNEKFVFWVPHVFFNNNNDNQHLIRFEIIHPRKYFPDLSLGSAECEIGSLFPELEEEIKKDDRTVDEKPDYYTDEEEGGLYGQRGSFDDLYNMDCKSDRSFYKTSSTWDEENREEEIENRSRELKKSLSLNMFNKENVKTGVLKVEMNIWTNYIRRIGESVESWPFAMNYDEFMMESCAYDQNCEINYKKKQKESVLMCFGLSTNTKD